MLFESILNVLQPSILLYTLLGVLAGMIIGTLPGLSATMGVAILTPITFWLEPTQGLAVLLGVYNSAIWSGGISAILINTPGTPASIAQTFDGYPMVKQKKIGLALSINTIYSVFGGLFSTLVLIVAAFPLARFALKFGPPEFFTLAVFGLSMMIAVSGKNLLKGVIMGLLGVILSTIGVDPMFSIPRFTFGNVSLLTGIPFVVALIGMFGIGEVMYQVSINTIQKRGKKESEKKLVITKEMGRIMPNKKELKESSIFVVIAAAFSSLVGAIPGTGGDIASIISWQQAKQLSKNPDEYGNGSYTGLAVASTANYGAIGGAMTTMMALGIPGDAVTAVLIGSLMMYGMQPGPQLFVTNAPFVYNLMALMIVGNLAILILGLATAKVSSLILHVKQEIIWLLVVGFCIIGSYAVNTSPLDVVIMFIAGFIGFLCKKADIPLGPFILALLLGPICESNFSRSLAMSMGNYSIFVTRPISAILLAVTAFSLCYPALKLKFGKKVSSIPQSEENYTAE